MSKIIWKTWKTQGIWKFWSCGHPVWSLWRVRHCMRRTVLYVQLVLRTSLYCALGISSLNFMQDPMTGINPQMPKVFRQPKTPKGGWMQSPWIFAFPSEFFENISHGYASGSRNLTVIMKKFYLSYDLENQGQTPFCVTFLISGCKHDTKSILVSILTFSRLKISKMLKKLCDLDGWPWNSRSHIYCMTFLSSGCIHAADLILVSILTFSMSRISKNPKSATWPWWLTLIFKVKPYFLKLLWFSRLAIIAT